MPPTNSSAEASTNKQKPQKIEGWAQLMIGSPRSIRDWKSTSLMKVASRRPQVVEAVLPAAQARMRSSWTSAARTDGRGRQNTPATPRRTRPEMFVSVGMADSSYLALIASASTRASPAGRHDAVVGHVEDRRLGVGVDGHDQVGVFHAFDVLRRAADSQGDEATRLDGHARLAHLPRRRQPALVDDRPRGADRPPRARASSSATSRFSFCWMPRPTATRISCWVMSTSPPAGRMY